MKKRAFDIFGIFTVVSILGFCYLAVAWARTYMMLRAERASVIARHGPSARVNDVSLHAMMPPSFWILLSFSVVLPLWWTYKRFAKRTEAGRCRNCGYDLRASPDRCPECGTPVKGQ